MPRTALNILKLLALWLTVSSNGSFAQSENPVFPDDSLLARDTLASLRGLIEGGNAPEAIRHVQTLLVNEADRMLLSEHDEALYVSVRSRVHHLLLESPELLDRYRLAETPTAEAMLTDGRAAEVERSWFLTRPGFESALRVARDHYESARFEAARLALEGLADHPDRNDAALRERAAEMWSLVYAVLPREDVAASARAWGDAALPEPIPWPASALQPSFRPSGRTEPLDPDSLVARPLRTVEIRPGAQVERDYDRVHPWIEPVASGEMLFVNDGSHVEARDRFTLSVLWRTTIRPGGGMEVDTPQIPSGRQGLDEPATVSVAGHMVLAVTGLPFANNPDREGDGRLHALDRDSGRVLWSIAPGDGPDELEGAAFRGAVRVEGDMGVLIARHSNSARRTGSAYVVGINLREGRIAWSRLIASAGSVGYQRDDWPGDWPIVHRGVVYAPDRVGAVAAVELASGRPRWVRVLPTRGVRRRTSEAMPWAVNIPIITEEGLFTVSPDRSLVVLIDPDDGRLVGRRPATDLGDPRYLLSIGTHLVGVSAETIGFVARHTFTSSPPALTRSLSENGLVGRVIVSGSQIVAPTRRGVALIDPAHPEAPRMIALDSPGALLPLGSQLVTCDALELHSYLVWEAAATLLDRRIRENPDDPDPAITLAELAHRAGRHERVLEGVDTALRALSPPGAGLEQPSDRKRLFEAIRFVVESGGRAWVSEPGPGGIAERAQTPAIMDSGLIASLLDRLDRVADTPEQRVVYLLLAGKFDESTDHPSAAAERYQSIVGEPALARATWQSAELAVGAGREATRRLLTLITTSGTGVYEPFEAQAEQELDALLALNPDANELERVARAYPVSRAAARAWLEAALLRGQAEDAIGSQAALLAGLETVEARRAGGGTVAPGIDAELAGRAATSLVADGRLSSAERVLDRFLARSNGARPTVDGRPIDAGVLATDLKRRMAAGRRLSAIGERFGSEVQTLRGWMLAEPMSAHRRHSAQSTVLLRDAGASSLGLFAPNAEGRFVASWTRRFEVPPEVVFRDAEAVYVFLDGPLGQRSLMRINTADGRTAWKTPGLLTLIGHDAPQRAVETPLDGWRRSDDLLLAMDGQLGVVASRTGRGAAIDLRDGHVLWRAQFPPDRLADLDAEDGMVAVAGERSRPNTPPNAPGDPVLALLDGRTGRVVSQITDDAGRIRWARLVRGDRVLAGFEASVVALTAPGGQVAWVARDTVLHESLGAWVFGENAAVLTSDTGIALGSLESGRFGVASVDVLGRRQAQFARSRLVADGDRLVLASEAGVAIFDPQGRLVGADGLAGTTRLVLPVVGEGAVFCVEADTAELTADGRGIFRVHLIGTESGKLLDTERLVLPSPPDSCDVADGVAVLTAGGTTYLIPVP